MKNLLVKAGRHLLTCTVLTAFLFAAAGCAGHLGMDAEGVSSPLPKNVVWRESPNLAELFQVLRAQLGLEGTFVLYDRERNELIGYNQTRANTRYQPASTFKILNALIAFETGVVKNQNTVLPYGGGPQPVPAWERDMTIQEAMAVSNVPLFQGIARRIGLERMREYVRETDYGNAEIGQAVDDF